MQNQIENYDEQRFRSSKKDYFFKQIATKLQSVENLAKSISKETIVPEALTGILKVALPALGGKLLGGMLPNIHIPGASIQSNLGDTCAVALGILGAWFAYKGIKEKSSAINAASKIVRFFECSPKLKSFLFQKLYEEFQLSIEMLVPSDEGIDILARFFIDCILETIDSISFDEESILDEATFLNDFRELMFAQRERIDTCKLKTEPAPQGEINWQLNELILHSPIVLAEAANPGSNSIVKFAIYLNFYEKKCHLLFFEKPAEGSHKYPVRLIKDQTNMLDMKNYRRDENSLPFKTCQIANSPVNKGNISYDQALSELYYSLREARNSLVNSKKKYNNSADLFVNFTNNLLQNQFYMENSHFHLLLNIENLRNIYWSEFKPHLGLVDEEHAQELQSTFEKLNNYGEVSPEEVHKIIIEEKENMYSFEEQEEKFDKEIKKRGMRGMLFKMIQDSQQIRSPQPHPANPTITTPNPSQ